MGEKLICLECGEEVYLEALATLDNEVVTTYDSAICSNHDCINGDGFAKYWDRIARIEGEQK